MGILFVGNTPTDFLGGVISKYAGSSYRDSSYVDDGTVMDLYGDSTNAVSMVGAYETAEFWHHQNVYFSNTTSSLADGEYMEFRQANGTVVAKVDWQDGQMFFSVIGATTVSSSPISTTNSMTTYDYHISVGTNIVFKIYTNGVLSYTLTVANNGKTGVRDAVCVNNDMVSSSGSVTMTECISTDNEPTVGWHLAVLKPNAVGNYAEMTGTYLGVQSDGDGSFLSATAVDQKHSWKLSSYKGNTNPGSIRAVCMRNYAVPSTVSPKKVVPFTRIGGVDYENAALDMSLAVRKFSEWAVNPATGSLWTVADLATVELGIKASA